MSIKIGKNITAGGTGRTEIYTQCAACGAQVTGSFESGTKISVPMGRCGVCSESRLDVAVQPEGTGAPPWWKSGKYAPIKTSGVKVDL